jgi:hypothetical protein
MNDRDPLVKALAELEVPPLDLGFAARVGARAKAELRASPRVLLDVPRLRRAVAAGLVPALLTLAAVLQTANLASTMVQIYGKRPNASSQ